MQNTLQLTKWEWFKVRRLRIPWILLAIAVLVSQLGIWVNYLAFNNETVKEVVGGGTASYSMSWDEDTPISVTITCSDVANDRMPAGFEQLTEMQREEFLMQVDAWVASGDCASFQADEQFRRGFTLPNSITQSIAIISSFRPIAVGPILIMILAASIVGIRIWLRHPTNRSCRRHRTMEIPIRQVSAAHKDEFRRACRHCARRRGFQLGNRTNLH